PRAGDARLERAGRVHEVALGEHAVDLEQGRVADGVEDGTGDTGVAHRQSVRVVPRVQPGGSLAGKLWSLSMSTSSSSSKWPLSSWSCLSSRSSGRSSCFAFMYDLLEGDRAHPYIRHCRWSLQQELTAT